MLGTVAQMSNVANWPLVSRLYELCEFDKYIMSLLFFRTFDQYNCESILKADFHGCFLTVSKSCCPSYIATTGIVIMETKNTFKIITKQNQVKCKSILNIFRREKFNF